jgi:hypothetical protein
MECPQCRGQGTELKEEDGRLVEDACYHCGTTGRISEEQARSDRVANLVGLIARVRVRRAEEACASDPEGEDWAFAAAESMCTLFEYRQGKQWEQESLVADEVKKLADWVVDDLIELVFPPPAVAPEAPKAYEDLPLDKQMGNEYPQPVDLGEDENIPF